MLVLQADLFKLLAGYCMTLYLSHTTVSSALDSVGKFTLGMDELELRMIPRRCIRCSL